jgi:hypothetical protein
LLFCHDLRAAGEFLFSSRIACGDGAARLLIGVAGLLAGKSLGAIGKLSPVGLKATVLVLLHSQKIARALSLIAPGYVEHANPISASGAPLAFDSKINSFITKRHYEGVAININFPTYRFTKPH